MYMEIILAVIMVTLFYIAGRLTTLIKLTNKSSVSIDADGYAKDEREKVDRLDYKHPSPQVPLYGETFLYYLYTNWEHYHKKAKEENEDAKSAVAEEIEKFKKEGGNFDDFKVSDYAKGLAASSYALILDRNASEKSLKIFLEENNAVLIGKKTIEQAEKDFDKRDKEVSTFTMSSDPEVKKEIDERVKFLKKNVWSEIFEGKRDSDYHF